MKCVYKNILESSTVTLSEGAENPSFPLYRVYDRNIGTFFKASAAATLTIKVDQGGSPLAVERLLIPSGHNLNGMTLDILYSTDDISYSPAVAQWVQVGSGLIEKSWSSLTKRFWKFKITTPASVPEFSELFLSPIYEWERLPGRPQGPFEDVFNVEYGQTASGLDRFLIHGNSKRQRVYRVKLATAAQKDNILDLNSNWAGAKPFWLYDHNGTWIFGRLRKSLNLTEEGYDNYSFDFDFIETF